MFYKEPVVVIIERVVFILTVTLIGQLAFTLLSKLSLLTKCL